MARWGQRKDGEAGTEENGDALIRVLAAMKHAPALAGMQGTAPQTSTQPWAPTHSSEGGGTLRTRRRNCAVLFEICSNTLQWIESAVWCDVVNMVAELMVRRPSSLQWIESTAWSWQHENKGGVWSRQHEKEGQGMAGTPEEKHDISSYAQLHSLQRRGVSTAMQPDALSFQNTNNQLQLNVAINQVPYLPCDPWQLHWLLWGVGC
jgi:hypothetical protein